MTSASNSSFVVESCVKDLRRGAILTNAFIARAQKEGFHLCEGSSRIMNTPNAGGSSIWSEAVSFEVLNCLFNAKLLKTEMELEYWPKGCKITDYSVELFGETLGVSVTRAMKFNGPFTEKDAEQLLQKKLYGVNVSSQCVLPEHGWKKQILHVWAAEAYVADVVQRTYEKLSEELKSNTLVVVTISTNANWIYRSYD